MMVNGPAVDSNMCTFSNSQQTNVNRQTMNYFNSPMSMTIGSTSRGKSNEDNPRSFNQFRMNFLQAKTIEQTQGQVNIIQTGYPNQVESMQTTQFGGSPNLMVSKIKNYKLQVKSVKDFNEVQKINEIAIGYNPINLDISGFTRFNMITITFNR